MNFIEPSINKYSWEHTSEECPLLQELAQETHEKLNAPQMLTGRVEGGLLRLLVGLSNAKKIIEVGTYSGYSALSMAEALPSDGHLWTLEISEEHGNFAQNYFNKSPHGDKIELLMGPALENLKKIPAPIDLAFIDADKENYPHYYESILEKLKPGGLIVADNVLWSGRVLEPVESSDKALAAFNEKINNDSRVEKLLLTVRDGIYLIRKKG